MPITEFWLKSANAVSLVSKGNCPPVWEYLKREFVFLSLLLIIAAIPLILWRAAPQIFEVVPMLGVATLWLGVCALWLIASTRRTKIASTVSTYSSSYTFGRILLIISGLLALTIISFYVPMRQHFWVGMDEIFELTNGSPWSALWDNFANRPLAMTMSFIGTSLTPSHVDGVLWAVLAAHWLTGILLYGIIKILLPRAELLALISSALFIVNPSEKMRFAGIFLSPFYGFVFFFMLAIYLYLRSYYFQNRLLLIVACLALAVSLLHYESVYPVGLLIPLLLLLRGRHKHFWVWTYAWGGTIALGVIRLLHFLSATSAAYQNYAFVSSRASTIQTLFQNLITQIMPIFRYFASPGTVLTFGVFSLSTALVIGIMVWRQSASQGALIVESKLLLLGLVITAIILIASVSSAAMFPSPPIGDYAKDSTLRFQFLASVPQAVVWALVIVLFGTFLDRQAGRVWAIVATGALVAMATGDSFELQSRNGIFNPNVKFERVSHIFQQVHRLAPSMDEDSAIFFAIDDDAPSPFGWNYYLSNLSCAMFGQPAYQGSYSPTRGWMLRTNLYGEPSPLDQYQIVNFKKALTFRVNDDGSVILMDTAPVQPVSSQYVPPRCTMEKLPTRVDAPLPFLLADGNLTSK